MILLEKDPAHLLRTVPSSLSYDILTDKNAGKLGTAPLITAMAFFIVAFLAIPVTAADDAEFAFNLLTDIAPVLALFGDQFAKQFTSESLTWVDHLIFAMVPLGIITAITGAIRVQGMPIARAFIGRARENRAQAEIELMSSTSDEVCEIFNGNSIVRTIGTPRITQFLIFPHEYEDHENRWRRFDQILDIALPEHHSEKTSCGIHSLQTAEEQGLVRCMEYRGRGTEFIVSHFQKFKKQLQNSYRGLYYPFKKSLNSSRKRPIDMEMPTNDKATIIQVEAKDKSAKAHALPRGADRAFRSPPNIQLNHTSDHFDERWMKKHYEIFLAALTGVSIQIGLIVTAAMVAFRVSSNESDLFESKIYGFPCYATGSLLLSVGTGLCSFIVERNTDEYSWVAVVNDSHITEDNAPRLLWLQNKQCVSDQSFKGYVIAAGPKKRIVTSSRNDKPERHRKRNKSDNTELKNNEELLWEWVTIGATLSAAFGFICQFMGLRGLAFPCSLAQLGAIFVMALVRAAIRRRLGEPIEHCDALPYYEVDFLATRIVFNQGPRSSYWVSRDDEEKSDPRDTFKWRIITPDPKQVNSRLFVPLAENSRTVKVVKVADRSSNRSSEAIHKNNQGAATINPSPTSQQLLRVRRRLGDLSRWKTRSSPSALALVQSIELVMNDFFPASSRELEYLNWLVQAGVSTETVHQDVIQFKIAPKKAGGKFEIDLGIVDAAMSLWMASIDTKKPRPTGEKNTKSKGTVDWRRERSGDSLIYDFYRIIGNNLEDNALKRDVSWWVDDVDAELYEQGKERSLFDKRDTTKSDADVVIGFNGIKVNEKHTTNEQRDTRGKIQPSELGILSQDSLPVILAQHLFTSFIWTVAQHLPEDCLQPKDDNAPKQIELSRARDFESYDFHQVWPRLKLSHQRLDDIVSKMESYGLGSRKDILLCIIPALSSRKLLPDQVVLKLIPRMPHTSGWVEIATFHVKLLGTVETMDIGDKLNIGIVTATMDFLSFACENYDENNPPSPQLDTQLKVIIKSLASTRFAETFQKLVPVYSKQRRLEMFKSIFQRVECPNPMTNSNAESNVENLLDESFAKKSLGFTNYHFLACSADPTDNIPNLQNLRRPPIADKDVIAQDVFGWTPYHYGCFNENFNFIGYVIDSRAVADRVCRLRCHYRRSPLDLACLEGACFEIDTLLSSLNHEEKRKAMKGGGIDGMTPLHLVAKSGSKSATQLIAREIDLSPLVTQEDFWGRQALHIASRLGHEDVATELLGLGAQSNTLDENGKTAIDYFLENKGRGGARIVSLDVGSGSQIDPADGDKTTYKYLDGERTSIFLRFAMKDHNCRYRHGMTFLHIAVQVAEETGIYKLLQKGFVLDARDNDGRTPLHYAILAGRNEISVNFIKGFTLEVDGESKAFRSNASLKDHRNITTLMLAAESNLPDVAEALLEGRKLQEVDTVDDDGNNALLHARGLEMVRFLVENGTDTVTKDPYYGRTRLHMALDEGDGDMASFLLHLEGPEKIQSIPFDKNGESLLLTACQRGLLELIPEIAGRWKHILNRGDAPSGQTPLAWACESGHKAVVEDLIDRGADMNMTTRWGDYTPLHICAVKGQFAILNLLIGKDLEKCSVQTQEGDDELKLEERDSEGQTPLEMCINAEVIDAECFKAIKGLLLHCRISSRERLRCLKEMVLVCASKDASELKPIFFDGLQKLIQDDLIQDFLLWLVGEPESIEPIENKALDTHALALLKPLVDALKSHQLDLRDPYPLITALCNTEIQEMIEDGEIDEQSGRDIDGWSCATYIERYDSHEELADLANQLRLNMLPHQLDIKPKALDWYHRSEEFWESVRVTPCFSKRPTNHTEVSEITVTEDSDLFHYTCIRTKHCIPASAKQFYFEVEILENSESRVVAIGFCGFYIGRYDLPGHFKKSWGYHGDDGLLFVEGNNPEEPNDAFGHSGTFSKGDTVGVYLDTKTGQGFCTKNGRKMDIGEVLKEAKDKFRLGKMYPCIGFSLDRKGVGLRLRVNLTGTGDYPFKYRMTKENAQLG